jgi:hypothetical protein
LEFEVLGFGFEVLGFEFRVQGLALQGYGVGTLVGLRVEGLGFEV